MDRHKPNYIAQFVDELGIGGELELPRGAAYNPCASQLRCSELTLIPICFAITAAVRWVASPGGSPQC